MAVHTCDCGAKVRVPEGGGTFRCPRCRQMISALAAVPSGAGAETVGSIGDRGSDASHGGLTGTCPTCQTAISPDQRAIPCPSCAQPHHKECWDEVGGCAIYGCKSAPQTVKQPDTQQPLSAWGDNKQCPMCGEQIKAIALKCRYCGANFDTVDPLSVIDVRKRLDREVAAKSTRVTVITIFVLSVFGIIAPLMLIVSLIYVLPRRDKIRKASPMLLVLGYAAIGVSGVFSLMMLFFAITS